jgi:hypothetical protein
MIEFTPLNQLTIHLEKLIKGRLWLKVIIGLVLGAGLGILLNPSTGLISENTSRVAGDWLDVPGHVFLRLVQMIMIPLIFASIITGIVSNTSKNLKSFGLKLLLYFLFTTIVSIVIGLTITFFMKPGRYVFELGGFPNSSNQLPVTDEAPALIENIPKASNYPASQGNGESCYSAYLSHSENLYDCSFMGYDSCALCCIWFNGSFTIQNRS